jgi:hypothetical protein
MLKDKSRFTIDELALLGGCTIDDIKWEIRDRNLKLNEYLGYNSTTKTSELVQYVTKEDADKFLRERCHNQPLSDVRNMKPNASSVTSLDIDEYVKLNRGKIPDDQLIYNLREMGFQNNQIGVALGDVYREGSNALAQKISRVYNDYKRKLGT